MWWASGWAPRVEPDSVVCFVLVRGVEGVVLVVVRDFCGIGTGRGGQRRGCRLLLVTSGG